MQTGCISVFGPIFTFCRIKLIFGRPTCFDRKAWFRNFFGPFALCSPEITYAKKASVLRAASL